MLRSSKRDDGYEDDITWRILRVRTVHIQSIISAAKCQIARSAAVHRVTPLIVQVGKMWHDKRAAAAELHRVRVTTSRYQTHHIYGEKLAIKDDVL